MCDSKWSGRVDVRLESLEETLNELKASMEEVKTAVAAHAMVDVKFQATIAEKMETQVALSKENKAAIREFSDRTNGDRFITYAFLREKLGVPVLVAGVIFVLFTVMPTVLGIIGLAAYLLPKLL